MTNTELDTIDAAASLIAKEMFGITKQTNKHFTLHGDEVYMVAFGIGPKNESNPKGTYVYWTWYKGDKPYGGLMICDLKTKYDAIDYYQTATQNAVDTINEVLNNESFNGQ